MQDMEKASALFYLFVREGHAGEWRVMCYTRQPQRAERLIHIMIKNTSTEKVLREFRLVTADEAAQEFGADWLETYRQSCEAVGRTFDEMSEPSLLRILRSLGDRFRFNRRNKTHLS